MRKLVMTLCVAGLAVGVGCSDDNKGGGGTDSGGIALPDAQTADSGGGGGADSGPGIDAGTTTGACSDAVESFPAAVAPRCYADANTCLAACRTTYPTPGIELAGCIDDCISADTFPGQSVSTGSGMLTVTCQICLNLQQVFCIDSMGCHDEWAAYACCIDANCPTQDAACIRSNCATQNQAIVTCAPVSCIDMSDAAFDICYSEDAMPGDGGVPDTDGGTPDTDGGVPDTDAGTPDTDAG